MRWEVREYWFPLRHFSFPCTQERAQHEEAASNIQPSNIQPSNIQPSIIYQLPAGKASHITYNHGTRRSTCLSTPYETNPMLCGPSNTTQTWRSRFIYHDTPVGCPKRYGHFDPNHRNSTVRCQIMGRTGGMFVAYCLSRGTTSGGSQLLECPPSNRALLFLQNATVARHPSHNGGSIME